MCRSSWVCAIQAITGLDRHSSAKKINTAAQDDTDGQLRSFADHAKVWVSGTWLCSWCPYLQGQMKSSNSSLSDFCLLSMEEEDVSCGLQRQIAALQAARQAQLARDEAKATEEAALRRRAAQSTQALTLRP